MSDPRRSAVMWQIRQHAKAALVAADGARKSQHFGAVNWADLRVCAVVYCENEEGQEWYRVDIEEADSCDLDAFVSDYLLKAGFPKVEIHTEW